MLQPDFLLALLQEATRLGFHTAVDTSGFAPLKSFATILPFTRLILYDLKTMNDRLHKELTGVSNRIILQNLEFLAGLGMTVRIRIPLLKGINNDKINLEQTILFLKRLKRIEQVDLLPFHKIGRSKYERLGMIYRMQDHAEMSAEEMAETRNIFEMEGFNVKIGG